MKGRRTRGTGSVRALLTGKWLARITKGAINGKRDVESRVHATKADAEQWLRDVLVRKDQGKLPATTRQTVAEYLEGWLRIKEGTIRPVTHASYRDTIRKHLTPALGSHRLQKGLTVSAIHSYISAKRQVGLSAKTIRYHIGILGTALSDGVPDLIAYNPCSDKRVRKALPKQERPEIHPLDEEEVRLFLAQAHRPRDARRFSADSAFRFYVLYRLALDSGMRQGELLGLRWMDVDLQRQRIMVRQTKARVGGFQAPKTTKSRRLIEGLRPETVEALRELRERTGGSGESLVFTTLDGQPLDARNVIRDFHWVLSKAGLKRRGFHALRHTMASLALLHNVHPKKVADRLGHADVALTLNTYSHLLGGGMQDDVVAALERALSGTEVVETVAVTR